MILTLGQTAKAVGLSKTTIIKHIENGKISASWNHEANPPQREIDASEIMRVYKVDVTIPPSRREAGDTQKPRDDTPLDLILKAKDETIATLKAQIDHMTGQIEVKDEQLATAQRLLAAPRSEDRYAALLEKLEKLEQEMATQLLPVEVPLPPKTEVAPRANHGILAKLLPTFFAAKAEPGSKAA